MSEVPAAATGELLITRTFDAPRELVFRAWTDSRLARQWWGPDHHPAIYLSLDPRPGGLWRGCLQSVETGKELWQNGVFHEVIAPERLVFTFVWEEEGERGIETLVTITFTEANGKTLMRFHQAPFQSSGERDGHTEGWSSSFDRLVEHLLHART